MHIVAVIPARMGSERLPGKVMYPVLGKPLLGHLLDRAQQSELLDEIVVAIPEDAKDNLIATYCKSRSIRTYRGSQTDVLSRLVEALQMAQADIGVMLFGDGPLVDARIIDKALSIFLEVGEYDFVGNDLITSWPPGMEVEVFKMDALADSAKRCKDLDVREHGTLFMRLHPELYTLFNVEAPFRCNRPDTFFEVDEKEDLLVIERLLENFGECTDASLEELIDFVDRNPHLRESTVNVHRRWKKYRSS